MDSGKPREEGGTKPGAVGPALSGRVRERVGGGVARREPVEPMDGVEVAEARFLGEDPLPAKRAPNTFGADLGRL